MANPNPSQKWKPGQSGNPRGSSAVVRGQSLTKLLKEMGEIEDVTRNGEVLARQEALAHKVWELALKGRENVIRYLYDRIDGRPMQTHEITGADGEPINVDVRFFE